MNPKDEYMLVDKRLGDIVSALRTIEDLKGLTEEELAWLAIHGTERFGDDGDLIFSQGTPPHHLMFILSGDVLVHRHSSSPVSVLIGQTGRITGKTPFSRIKAWNADGRSSGKTWILELHDSHFPELLNAIPSMTQRIIRVLLDRNREYTRAEEQIGKLAALNRLAANLAHELNNPASAAKSAASQLLGTSDIDHEKLAIELEWLWAQNTNSMRTWTGYRDCDYRFPAPVTLQVRMLLQIVHYLKTR